MEYSKDYFNRMVGMFRENIGCVFALYDPKPGEIKQGTNGSYKPLIKVNNDLEKFKFHAKKYIDNYKAYSDEPMVYFDNDYKLFYIIDSWNYITDSSKRTFSKGAFYGQEQPAKSLDLVDT